MCSPGFPARQLKENSRISQYPKDLHKPILYMYIYVCVCVCVCMCIYMKYTNMEYIYIYA